MLKEIFSQRLSTQSKTVNNAIITLGDIDDSGKGRKFKSRFLTPGIAGYPGQFGNVLIKKESFDKFINTLEGAPVIINHKDLTEENANDARVGVVSNVWFNDKDGLYWCDGIIWDKTAQNLITDKGWSVSCSYDVKLADDTGGTENNVPYDIEFLDGVFTHLAIVNNPRYERANIVLNSKTVVQNFNPNHDAEGKFCSGSNVNYTSYGDGESAHVIPVEYLNEGKHAKQYGGLPIDEYYKKTGQYRKLRKKLSPTPQDNKTMQEIAGYILEDELYNLTHTKYNNDSLKNVQIDMIKGIKKSIKELEEWFDLSKHEKKHMSKSWLDYLEKHPEEFKNNTVVTNATEDAQGNLHSKSNGQFVRYKNTGNPRTFVDNNNPLSNASIYIITHNEKKYNPNNTKNGVNNEKEQNEMTLVEELKKLILKVENANEDEMDKDKDKEKEKIENEKVDKRDIIRQIMAIAGKREDDEDVRTIAKLAEKLAYDKSEAGTADNEKEDDPEAEKDTADNKKVKNEETKEDEKKYDDLKKDVKEDVKNKCKNSVDNAKGGYFDKMNEIYNSAIEPKKENLYVSRADRLEAGKSY